MLGLIPSLQFGYRQQQVVVPLQVATEVGSLSERLGAVGGVVVSVASACTAVASGNHLAANQVVYTGDTL